MPLPLASRIALVTGASRGIGYATARALARAGAHVVAVARTQAGLEELDDEIQKDGGSALSLLAARRGTTWMAGTSPAMTKWENAPARLPGAGY